MSTSSDHEMSEESNSPQMFIKESPQSSPSQQVPQLTNCLTGLTCADTFQSQYIRHSIGPYLRIIEQPQNHFRFRYVSEMVGTHGCLLGKSSTSKNKTHPTVELVNYDGEAIIRCRLAQSNVKEEHPHKLLEDEQDRDVSYRVPEQGSYKVGFAGMGIIHTAKKDVSGILFKKMSEECKNSKSIYKDLRAHCDNKAKTINLNIVRLRFSAHDPITGKEICEAVYSDPIHNMKSAATNDLKICRISRITGRASGGEDVYILVEKVNKKNIEIHIYELDNNGKKCWSARGYFTQTDVHHQYAIVFRTPAYRDSRTTVDVKVLIELVRPSDGRTSEPVEFTYKAEDIYKQIKKRKAGSSYSSIDSSSGGSIKNNCGIPTTVLDAEHDENIDNYKFQIQYAIPQVGVTQSLSPNHCDLGSALSTYNDNSPLLGQASALHSLPHNESIIDLKLNSADFEKLLQNDTDLDPSDIKLISDSQYLGEYLVPYSDLLPDGNNMEFMKSLTMVSDSGRAKGKNVQRGTIAESKESENIDVELVPSGETKPQVEYPAYYTAEDGLEVKKLVKEFCDIMRNKNGYKKQLVRNKLERLFELRLSNGDTFLHMMLCSNQSSLEHIVKIIHNVRMTHLLDYANNKQQTALHLAVANDMPQMVALLVEKGSNPMAKDYEEHNAVHYAVKYQCCLEVLLDTIEKHNVPRDLNATNSEKQTPLHLAAIAGCEVSTRTLLRHGAGYSVRDTEGRTPLHLAAYDDRLAVTRALLDYIPSSDVDVIDGCGNTALQIICGGSIRENTIEIATLLLQKKADPLRNEEHNKSAWRLVLDKPALRNAVYPYVDGVIKCEEDVKSEPEDEYESADDAEMEEGLCEMELYVREVSAVLDARGAWRALAARVRLDALLAWYAAQPSPTATLLNHLKESRDDITSKSLALILDDIGQHDAASIIRRHIN